MIQVYVDMDGVLADFDKSKVWELEQRPEVPFPQSTEGFFLGLEPVENALEGIHVLEQLGFEVLFLTAPSTKNPHCWTEKAKWIEEYFGFDYLNKLIITERKELLYAPGRYLIDDCLEGKGQDVWNKNSALWHFKDWPSTIKHFISVAQLAAQ